MLLVSLKKEVKLDLRLRRLSSSCQIKWCSSSSEALGTQTLGSFYLSSVHPNHLLCSWFCFLCFCTCSRSSSFKLFPLVGIHSLCSLLSSFPAALLQDDIWWLLPVLHWPDPVPPHQHLLPEHPQDLGGGGDEGLLGPPAGSPTQPIRRLHQSQSHLSAEPSGRYMSWFCLQELCDQCWTVMHRPLFLLLVCVWCEEGGGRGADLLTAKREESHTKRGQIRKSRNRLRYPQGRNTHT